MKSFVLDSTAFYASIPFTSTFTYYTTPEVLAEVSHGTVREAAIQSLVEVGRLKIMSPSANIVETVEESARASGDFSKLSATDISILALALQLKSDGLDISTVSDDYSVENSAKTMGIPVDPVLTRGISKTVKWITYCRGCGKVFNAEMSPSCDVCGTALSRKWR